MEVSPKVTAEPLLGTISFVDASNSTERDDYSISQENDDNQLMETDQDPEKTVQVPDPDEAQKVPDETEIVHTIDQVPEETQIVPGEIEQDMVAWYDKYYLRLFKVG